jgi:hypothetical protein
MKKQKQLSKDEANKELVYQIGRVTRKWQSIESSLWFFLSALLKIDQFRARIIAASLQSSRGRLDLISKLGETYIDPPLLPRFRKLMKRTNELRLHRNKYVHAPIGDGTKPGNYLFMMDVFLDGLDRPLSFDTQPININHTKTIADALDKLYFALRAFCDDLGGNIHTSARRHREVLEQYSRNSRRKKTTSGKP